ncbi:hypothetical protein AN958_07698 [Leucoagaricus sp. SymC.cos]|nr:hypothetical protein AN958_07698 [Leucoagaricus sp. SymC.cos]
MSDSNYDKQLTSELRSKLAEALKGEPGLSAKDAMRKVTREMLKSNPFVPPEGDKCPINVLPDELLAYVFETGMQMEEDNGDEEEEEDDEDYDEFDDETERELPFQVLVSHVCKRWRSVALDTPALWTHLHLDKTAPLDKHKAYVERAKNAPLDIIIDCTFDNLFDFDYDEEAMAQEKEKLDRELVECLRNISELSEILDLIIPRVKHWRTLSVAVSDYRWIYLFLARLHQCGPADTLENMEFYHYDDNDSGEIFHPRELVTRFVPFQGQAPQLQQAVFWGVHLDWEASLNLLKNVEDVELAYHMEDVRPSYRTFEAIAKSPHLNNLSLSLSGPRETEDEWRSAGVEQICLPTLQGLTLRYHSIKYARSLLRFIDTPNLTSLYLDFDEEDYTEFASDLCKASSGRTKSLLAGLEKFKLSGLPCSRVMVDKMLDQLTNLKCFNLNCAGEGELFFEALLRTTSGSHANSSATGKKVYCPQLEEITTTGITGTQMKEFVVARAKAGLTLKKVFMSEDDDVDVNVEQWLKENVHEFEFFSPSDSEEEIDDDEIDELDMFAH